MLFIFLALFIHSRADLQSEFASHFLSRVFEPKDINCTSPSCDGPLAPIYCFGPILFTSYALKLEGECPGKRMKHLPKQIIKNFNELKKPIERENFKKFCEENFEATSYVEQATLPDWVAFPEKLNVVDNPDHRKLANFINGRWKMLAKQFTSDVFKNAVQYPVLPVKRHFIVPGEPMFDVYFYWDTYWINKGLLLSGMFETVKGIIDNYADLIDIHGFIPNGGYIYFQKRSQPPVFIQMVEDYYSYTKDLKSVERWLPYMDQEMLFWMEKRSIPTGDVKGMYIYEAGSDCPRPENFISDYYLGIRSNNSKFTWKALSSACESGWDFSSRWFKDSVNKYTIKTQEIIPVDLNVFMARNLRIMSKFKKMVGEEKFGNLYEKSAKLVEDLIHQFMWNNTAGIWFDLNKNILTHRPGFYPTNLYPLLLKPVEKRKIDKIKKYLKSSNILNYPGGVPATLPRLSFEQWDFPNVWAPNQHLFIMSLWNSGDQELISEGTKQALKFIEVVYKGVFKQENGETAGLWEKYNASRGDGSSGGGGEYPVQEGFGWTNGAVLDLMVRLASSKKVIERSAATAWWKPFAGGSPHIYIVGGLLTFLISVAIAYSLCGISNKIDHYGHLSDEDQASASLLGGSE